MKANSFNDERDDSRLDHDDPVWRLLGQAPMPQPDAWFTARTVARCRHADLSGEAGWIALGRVWRWVLGGGLALTLAIALIMPQIRALAAAQDQKKSAQEAFEVVASLETDSDSSSWQDSSL